jgi:hypothetical protein
MRIGSSKAKAVYLSPFRLHCMVARSGQKELEPRSRTEITEKQNRTNRTEEPYEIRFLFFEN